MNNRIRTAALLGFLAVVIGTFGAHGLKQTLITNETTEIWETAQQYHLFHAIVLLVLATRSQTSLGAFLCFVVGIAIFSGSLYVLAITGIRWLGAITPIGGVAFLVGWLWLLVKPNGVES